MNEPRNLDPFFECVAKALNKSKRAVTILAALTSMGLLALFSMVFMSDRTATVGQIQSFVFILFCLALMFAVPFFQLYKKSKFYKRKDFKWFIKNPESVLSYTISQQSNDLPSVELKGKSNTTKINVGMELSEVEKRLFQAFPHLKPDYEIGNKTENIYNIRNTVSRNILLQNIPSELRKYFVPKIEFTRSFVRKNMPQIVLMAFLSIVFFVLLYHYFVGVPSFPPESNSPLTIIILYFSGLLSFISILSISSKYTEQADWLEYFQSNMNEVAWIYPTKSKTSINYIPTGTVFTIQIHNSKGKQIMVYTPKDQNAEVMQWLSEYFPNAIIGFSHEYEKQYSDDPKNFLNKVKLNANYKTF